MAAALAALLGVSAWVSLGTQAVTNGATLARVAAFPPLWLLPILAVSGVVAAIATRLAVSRAWPFCISLLLWLPYLPGSIPAAFLIWQGSIEILVWIVIVAGVLGGAASGWPRRSRDLVTGPGRARLLAGVIVALCAVAGFTAVRGIIPNGDEPHYLAVTQCLLLDGDLRIENNYARGDYLSYFPGRLRPDYLQRGTDGQIYSVHAPGISVAMLPAFALAGYIGAVSTVILSVALAASLTWEAAWLLSGTISAAWLGWAAVFLTTPFFFHSFAIYPDGPAALLVMTALLLLVRLEVGRDVSRRRIWIAGAALAILPWFHTRFAVVAATLGVALLVRLWADSDARARVVALLTVPALAAAAWFGYFWIIWGTLSPSAPYGAQTNASFAYIGRGTTGLLIDQQFGVIATAPVLAVAVLGVVSLARRHPRFTAEWVVIVGSYIVAAASYAMWWGGDSAPARFLVALVPMLALPIAWWWARVESRAWRALALLLLLVSMVMMLARAWVDGGRLLYNNRTGFDLLLDWAAQSVDLPLAFPSVHREGIDGALGDTLIWLAAGVAVAAVAQLLTRPPRRSAGATWTVITLTTAVASMAASTVVWGRQDGPVVTAARSSIAALDAYRSRWHSTIVQISPFRLRDNGDFPPRLEFGTTDRVRPGPADPTLLRAAAVPAGTYQVVTSSGVTPRGAMTIVIGPNDPPIERWTTADYPSGLTSLSLHLPVAVGAVTIRGDDQARTTIGTLRLRAISVQPPANADGRRAVRAVRYGRARVFFFDEQAYLEPNGFWTRADGTATLVIDGDDKAAAEKMQLLLKAGEAATTIDARVGSWHQSIALAPLQSEVVTLPPANEHHAWELFLKSGHGFRPSAIDPASNDVRNLAAWVEIRQP